MSDRRINAFRTTLQLVCQLLWVLGLVVALGGVYLLMKYKQCSIYFSSSYITMPAILALATAAFLLASGLLGSWLSIRHSTCLQGLFVYLLVVVFCLEVTASALAFFHSRKLESETSSLIGVFHNYTGNSQDPNSQAVDATQEEVCVVYGLSFEGHGKDQSELTFEKLQCCGVHDYRDWLETPWSNRTGRLFVPQSCCNSTFSSCNGTMEQPWQLYSQGCQVKLEAAVQFVLSFIIWCCPAVLLVEVFVLITVAQLMRNQPLREYHILDKN